MFRRLTIILISIVFLSCEGPEGPAGPSGMNTLLKTSSEAAGVNCSFGGFKIDSGPDANGNGTLDNGEIQATSFICTDNTINNTSLIRTTPETAGTNCLNGGIKIEAGTDTDHDGVLDSGEITATNFVCNGNTGEQDNQIRFLISSYGLNGHGTSSTTGELYGTAIKFDKRNYPGLTSIVFSPTVFIDNAMYQTYAELYNVTDGVVIANSAVSPSSAAIDYVHAEILQSANILNDLPAKEITLSIRLRSSNSGSAILVTRESYLIMTRE